jgi:hypothetical protein
MEGKQENDNNEAELLYYSNDAITLHGHCGKKFAN